MLTAVPTCQNQIHICIYIYTLKREGTDRRELKKISVFQSNDTFTTETIVLSLSFLTVAKCVSIQRHVL